MIATIDPDKPIWDQYVLQNLGLELKGKNPRERVENAILIYDRNETWYLLPVVAHTLATEGAVTEQVETVWTGMRKGHVGRICGKKRKRLWQSATGFFDWKNSTAYFLPLILYSYPQIRYSIHVPNDRYKPND